VFSLFIVLLQVASAPDSSAYEGYQGNLYLQNNQLQDAQAAYERGLTLYPTDLQPEETYHGLHNNLGLVLNSQGNLEGAETAFNEAITSASDTKNATRALYNAGNNAFGLQQNEAALERYRQALLADPDNEEARFNYEYVKRLQQNQESQQNQEQEDQEQQQNQQEQDQEQNQEQQEQDQQEDQQQQEQEQQEQDQQQNQEQQEQPSQPQDSPMSREEAERILQALANDEKELLREVQKGEGSGRRVTKDW